MATITSTLPISSLPSLPPRLLTFFARYPPSLYSVKHTGASIPLIRPKKSLLDQPPPPASPSPSLSSTTTTTPTPLPEGTRPLSNRQAQSQFPSDHPNPFLPSLNPLTNRWRAPTFSLRRQAELFKLARTAGVENLLPPSRKATEWKEARVVEVGSQIRGTGAGRRVKGHKWERGMERKLEKRRKAMEEMPEMIRAWKAAGWGRGWKKFPR